MEPSPIRASLYDGRSSAPVPVLLRLARAADGPRLRIDRTGLLADTFATDAADHDAGAGSPGRGAVTTVSLEELRIDERVGAVHRLVHLPDGASLEIRDDAEFDALLAAVGRRRTERALRGLERHWGWALAALVVVVATSWIALRYAAPAAARHVADALPAELDAKIGQGGIALLDRQLFAPSALPPGRRAQLRRAFDDVLADLPPGHGYRLEFRRGGKTVGPNAFALPAGIVVVTDELVALAAHDDELRAVFAHEVGHLRERHSLRLLLQSAGVAVLVGALLGDVSGTGGLVVAVPTVLVNSGYSRDFEREADAYAYRWMERNGVAAHRLGDLLRRLEREHGGGGGYLSTHPPVDERARAPAAR